jgi:hypothetical protein
MAGSYNNATYYIAEEVDILSFGMEYTKVDQRGFAYLIIHPYQLTC